MSIFWGFIYCLVGILVDRGLQYLVDKYIDQVPTLHACTNQLGRHYPFIHYQSNTGVTVYIDWGQCQPTSKLKIKL